MGEACRNEGFEYVAQCIAVCCELRTSVVYFAFHLVRPFKSCLGSVALSLSKRLSYLESHCISLVGQALASDSSICSSEVKPSLRLVLQAT